MKSYNLIELVISLARSHCFSSDESQLDKFDHYLVAESVKLHFGQDAVVQVVFDTG